MSVRPLAYALTYMHPALIAALCGQGDAAARDAAADVLDDLLAEAAEAAADLAEVA